MRTSLLFGSAALAMACGNGGNANAPSIEAGTSDSASTTDGSIADAGQDAVADAATKTHPVEIDHACSDSLHVRVTILDDAVLRLHYVVAGAPQVDRGWIYDVSAFTGPGASIVSDTAGALHVQTGSLDLQVTGNACAIAIRAHDGAVLWNETAPFARDSSGKTSLARALADGERIYGLGEKTGAAMRRGRSFEMWNSDPAWSDPTGQYQTTTDPIYQSHPYFLSILASGHASGTYLANTNHTSFDVGKTAGNALAMSATAGDMDLFFFDGPSPAEVIERYTRLVGRAPLPPLWALGYHQSRWSYTPSSRAEEVAFEFRQRNLPADGLWLDIDYMDGFRDFTWNPSTFAAHTGMLTRLAAAGFKVTTIFDPGIKSDPGGSYSAYTDGLANGMFIAGSDGSPVLRDCWPGAALFPDFTRSDVRAWWGTRLGDFMSAGTRGAWIDMNEPAVFVKTGFPLDAHADGDGTKTTFAEVKNVYALLMAKATYEGQLKAFADRRPFVLTRAGFAGIQRYAAVWTGDMQSTWDHLAMTPAMLQGMGLSGIVFAGSDVGGFTGSPPSELYARWFELGAVSPFFRSHVATGAPDQEPWAFGPEVEDDARRMLALRYSLLPYWYDAFALAHETGAPIVRPLWFDAAGDDESHRHEDEFFIGPSLLAAPVTAANVTSRNVYLPAGVYYDFYSGAAYSGPANLTMPAPLGRFPTFVRAGSVLPTEDVQNYVGEMPLARRYLDVYPGPAGTTSTTKIHEDDGESLATLRGEAAITSIALAVTAAGLTLKTDARTEAYVPPAYSTILRVHGVPTAPTAASIDGASATELAYDPSTRVASVPLGDFATAHTIAIAYDASALPAPRQLAISFQVTLPANTPAGNLYIASSAQNWQPAGQLLTRNGSSATANLTALEGTLVKYKITRGAWSNVEVDGSCASLPNRMIVAQGGAPAATIAVAHWADACP